MIFAINHPTCNNKTEVKKFLILTNLYKCLRADSPEHIRILSVMACNFRNIAITLKIPPRGRAKALVKSSAMPAPYPPMQPPKAISLESPHRRTGAASLHG